MEGTVMNTAAGIKAMKTRELVSLYNRLTKKHIKKFSSRAAGEKQVAAAIAAKGGTEAVVRVVKGSAGETKALGRPSLTFAVELTTTNAQSEPNSKSLRRQLIDWLEAREGKAANIEPIEAHFKCNMRGVINKLEEKGWLKRREPIQ